VAQASIRATTLHHHNFPMSRRYLTTKEQADIIQRAQRRCEYCQWTMRHNLLCLNILFQSVVTEKPSEITWLSLVVVVMDISVNYYALLVNIRHNRQNL
jgi:hypothetical protein